MNEGISNQSPMMLRNGNVPETDNKTDNFDDPMLKSETIKLVKAFTSIEDKKLSHQILDLMVALSSFNH